MTRPTFHRLTLFDVETIEIKPGIEGQVQIILHGFDSEFQLFDAEISIVNSGDTRSKVVIRDIVPTVVSTEQEAAEAPTLDWPVEDETPSNVTPLFNRPAG